MNILVIPASERQLPSIWQLSDDGEIQIREMHTIVGGSIDVIGDLRSVPMEIWRNDSGRMLELPINGRAARLLESIAGRTIDDPIYGDVFVSGRTSLQGTRMGIRDVDVQRIVDLSS